MSWYFSNAHIEATRRNFATRLTDDQLEEVVKGKSRHSAVKVESCKREITRRAYLTKQFDEEYEKWVKEI